MKMNERLRALVIGYGSIGQRHARLLTELGIETACVTQQLNTRHAQFSEISTAIASWRPNYVVISSPTTRHASDLSSVIDESFQGPILVEKPIFSEPSELETSLPSTVFVGYNLRFHDAVGHLRQILAEQQILTVSIWNAQYLPDWRPGRDYRRTSSAERSAGGGVLRDLSHDLDLLLYLFGNVRKVFAKITRTNTLEIDTEDCVLATLVTDSCETVSLYLSYLDRIPRHDIRITTSRATIYCDFLTGHITVNEVGSLHATDRDDTFKRMHLALLKDDRATACSVADAMLTVRTICAMEESAVAKIEVSV